MAKGKPKTSPKTPRRRFRSNVFHPKVKQPVTFELTETGHEKLIATMERCKVSIGDLVEYLLRKRSAGLTEKKFEAAR
jgi:hypothetical protein